MKHASKLLLSLLAILLFMGCKKGTNMVTTNSANDSTARNSIYHWKTTFNLDSADVSFLKKHDVKRIYVRMFDVATEPNFLSEGTDVVPIATTKFESPVPKDVEIVPVTYITLDALREMQSREAEFANIIIERLLAMASSLSMMMLANSASRLCISRRASSVIYVTGTISTSLGTGDSNFVVAMGTTSVPSLKKLGSVATSNMRT